MIKNKQSCLPKSDKTLLQLNTCRSWQSFPSQTNQMPIKLSKLDKFLQLIDLALALQILNEIHNQILTQNIHSRNGIIQIFTV